MCAAIATLLERVRLRLVSALYVVYDANHHLRHLLRLQQRQALLHVLRAHT